MDPPHDKKIVAVQFQPKRNTDDTIGPLAMTAGRDGKFKIWILAEEAVIKGKSYYFEHRVVYCLHLVALSKPATVHFCCLRVNLVPRETFSKGRWLVPCPQLLSITLENDMSTLNYSQTVHQL